MTVVSSFSSRWGDLSFGGASSAPWEVTSKAEQIISAAIGDLSDDHDIVDSVAIHKTVIVENGAILKGPVIVGENAFVAHGAYLRGGVFLDNSCIVGPNCELKSVSMLRKSKITHLSFVGDSILGSHVNIEAGAVLANYRNEKPDKSIRILFDGQLVETQHTKFGAMLGDSCRVGANAVIAPGALCPPETVVSRLQLLDMSPSFTREERA